MDRWRVGSARPSQAKESSAENRQSKKRSELLTDKGFMSLPRERTRPRLRAI